MRSSYTEEDVILLLKDITGFVEPQSTEERERLIQAGRHYCEMLPIEYVPTERYMETYQEALLHYAESTAQAVGKLADKIMIHKGKQVVLVSLARAGIPIGILLKRYIKWKYNEDILHYSISIIRGKGIDDNAMKFILDRHQAKNVLFVDGWIGKGAIQKELDKEAAKYEGLSSQLAVLADPAHITSLYGTYEDILIPSSCLNSTISGLISRTFLREDIIGQEDFHGAVFYEELINQDLSYDFINEIQSKFKKNYVDIDDISKGDSILEYKGIDEVNDIANKYKISNINLIKPSIGETTRVLLRRFPWKVLIGESSRNDPSLQHIIRLAIEKGVDIEYYPLKNYKACGLIKNFADT